MSKRKRTKLVVPTQSIACTHVLFDTHRKNSALSLSLDVAELQWLGDLVFPGGGSQEVVAAVPGRRDAGSSVRAPSPTSLSLLCRSWLLLFAPLPRSGTCTSGAAGFGTEGDVQTCRY